MKIEMADAVKRYNRPNLFLSRHQIVLTKSQNWKHYGEVGLSYAAIFCGSHSVEKRRTSKAALLLPVTAPHKPHLTALGNVMRGP